MMKDFRKYFIVAGLLFGVVIIISCNRKVIPGFKQGKQGKEFDMSSFSWYYVEATRQKLLGNMGDALENLEKCIAVNPESDAAYYQIAQIMLNNGKIETGKKYLWKAAELQPGNLWYHMTLAGIYYQQKNLDSAIICYEKAVKANPDKENLQLSLADLYTTDKKFDKARSILNRFDEKYGVNENTTLSLIRTLMAEKKYGDAKRKVELLLEQRPDDVVYNGLLAEIYSGAGDNKNAFTVFNRLLERHPGDPQVQLSLCEFLISEKNYEGLVNLLDTVVANERVKKEEKVAMVAGLIDNQEFISGYGAKFESVVKKLEENYRDDEMVALIRPELLQKEGKLGEAASLLEEIIRKSPDNYYACEKLLMVYYDLKDWTKLETKGKEYSTRFNRSILAKILYANSAMENKNFQIALEELRKADILAGDNKEIKLQVLTMKADIYYRMKNYGDAFKAFDEALKLNDSDLTVMNNYAYYLAEQNMKLKEAEEMIKKVIEKEGTNNTFLDTYAWVLYKRGKVKQAAKIMDQIINSGEKDDAEWYEHYGFILKRMGRCDDAVQKWQMAITLDESKGNLEKEIIDCKR